MKFYYIATNNFCGGVAVDENGKVDKFNSAPYMKYLHGKSFREFLNKLKKSNQLISCKKIGD